MPPRIPSNEVGLRLALCGCIREGEVTKIDLAQYLLHLLHELNPKQMRQVRGLTLALQGKCNLYEFMLPAITAAI